MTDKPETVGEGVKFERIRRITGYLVGTTDRFNDGKRAEERDRVKHIGPAGQVLGDFTGSSQLGQQAKVAGPSPGNSPLCERKTI